jgi:aminotransferase EvaB
MIKIFDMLRRIEADKDELLQIINTVVESGNFIQGEQVDLFENNFARYTGAKYVTCVANATDGLEIALKGLGIKPGDKVLTVANAGFYSTAAIINIGAIPTYVDTDERTFNISLEKLKTISLSAVKCIIVTHLYGLGIIEIQEIANYCLKLNIPLIEDCSQAHGSKVNNIHVGTFGDAGIFSFYPTKNLGALGDAGCIITNDLERNNRFRKLRNYGWSEKYSVHLTGGRNSRTDEFQAAILSFYLTKLDKNIKARRNIAGIYKNSITNPKIKFQESDNSHSYHLFVITTRNRNKLINLLRDNGVESVIHFPVPDHMQVANMKNTFSLPNTEDLADTILSIPCYPELHPEEALLISNIINEF